MAKKIRRIKLSSLIVVGEGPHDGAFLSHMKDLYDSRLTDQKVKIASADGGSPKDILNTVIKNRHIAYDRKFVLMDSDVALTQKDRELAKRNKIVIYHSEPICLEGMLLDILNENIPATNKACKASLHPKLSGLPTEKSSYSDLFTE